jgi:hypothetical protein
VPYLSILLGLFREGYSSFLVPQLAFRAAFFSGQMQIKCYTIFLLRASEFMLCCEHTLLFLF